jgi:lipopolysaccharide transport system ATP-binding protein
MKTKSGKKVNSIIMNEEYLYSFEVIFDMDVKNVIFGSRFTTVKGFFISGMSSKNSLMKTFNVKKGERYLIEYQFTCTLLPGNYYITVNVSGDINNKRVPLNHITDAYVFKVRNTPPAKQRGIVHLNQNIKVEKIFNR